MQKQRVFQEFKKSPFVIFAPTRRLPQTTTASEKIIALASTDTFLIREKETKTTLLY